MAGTERVEIDDAASGPPARHATGKRRLLTEAAQVGASSARGQYAAGWQGGEQVLGYLDEQGAVAIPAKFFQAHDFRGGLARVRFETERVVLSFDER